MTTLTKIISRKSCPTLKTCSSWSETKEKKKCPKTRVFCHPQMMGRIIFLNRLTAQNGIAFQFKECFVFPQAILFGVEVVLVIRTHVLIDLKHLIFYLMNTLRYTNKKGRSLILDEWNDVTTTELNAFIGILLMVGVHKSNMETIDELWNTESIPLYRPAMSRNRFKMILRTIRFDDANTRAARVAENKTAPINDIWLMLNANLRMKMSLSTSNCTHIGVERVSPNTYQGKLPNAERQANLGEKTVLALVQPYSNSNRNVTTDNFFSSLPLSRYLREKGLTLVGTMRANKACIPPEMKPQPTSKVGDILFGFRERETLVSQVVRAKKSVYLLSTMHFDGKVSERGKPMITEYYNATKGGVDVMDHMLGSFTCKRKTCRWPLAFFFNMLHVAALVAFIIYCDTNELPPKRSRRGFLKALAREACLPNILDRAQNPRILGVTSTRMAIESVLHRDIAVLSPMEQQQSMPQQRDSDGRLKKTGTCNLCKTRNGIYRQSRKKCVICQKSVCQQHTETICVVCASTWSRVQSELQPEPRPTVNNG